jgi:hypothetical protein
MMRFYCGQRHSRKPKDICDELELRWGSALLRSGERHLRESPSLRNPGIAFRGLFVLRWDRGRITRLTGES